MSILSGGYMGSISSGSSGRVRGRETWNLCGRFKGGHYFYDSFSQGQEGGHGPLGPPGPATEHHPLNPGGVRHPVEWELEYLLLITWECPSSSARVTVATRPVSKQRLTLSEISRIVFLSSTHVVFIQQADTRLLCWTNHPITNIISKF